MADWELRGGADQSFSYFVPASLSEIFGEEKHWGVTEPGQEGSNTANCYKAFYNQPTSQPVWLGQRKSVTARQGTLFNMPARPGVSTFTSLNCRNYHD